jgi:ketosteroid isomerase-like protein
VARFTDAYEHGDTEAIITLLSDDITLTMPPLPFIYQGRGPVADFLTAICATRRFRLIPTRANGQPAFGFYLCDPTAPVARAHGLILLTLSGEQITDITRFLDNSILTRFGLPRILPG